MKKLKPIHIRIIAIVLVVLVVLISILVVNNGAQRARKGQAYGALEIEKPYNNYPPVPQGYTHKEGTVETGYVIQDAEGNEFVWIPIDGERIEQTRKDYEGETLIANCRDELSQEHIDSLNQYRGFYIGRYEASSEGISKAGGIPTSNITKTQAKLNCENYNDTENRAESVSHLIYGIEYDMAIQFIETESSGYGTSSDKGNYTEDLKNTGNSSDIVLNIYDLAGNLREWTMEEKTSNGAGVIRGGSYNNTLPAGNRSNDNPESKDKYIGYRVAMYVKDVDISNPSLKATIAVNNTTSTGFDVEVTVENAVDGIAKIEVFVDRTVNKTVNNPEENTNTITIAGKETGKEYEVYARVTDGLGRKTISKIEKATPEKKYVWAKYNVDVNIEEIEHGSDISLFLESSAYLFGNRTYYNYNNNTYSVWYSIDEIRSFVVPRSRRAWDISNGNFVQMSSGKIYHVYGLSRHQSYDNGDYGYTVQVNYVGKADIYKREYVRSDYIEEVESTRENAYVKGGVQGEYWYEYIGTK